MCVCYLTGIQQSHHGPGVLHEVCTRETLNISCSDNRRQVVFIRTARYGRMRLGRCVRKSYDYLGCAVDVRGYMDTRCSGRHGCSMRIPDDVMHEMQPCPPDLTPYLEVSYDCVDGWFFCFRFCSAGIASPYKTASWH
jgi:Galactose binding lectin domain